MLELWIMLNAVALVVLMRGVIRQPLTLENWT